MKKFIYKTMPLLLPLAMALNASGQSAFSTKEYIDINNLKAAALVHGDLWWDPQATTPQCEYPKGSGKHIMNSSSIWMAGYDNTNTLHQSAQTYRQSGNDYWPGPLDNNASVSYSSSTDWAKIWKVNRTDIIGFTALSSHTVMNTPPCILEWPAKNNPYAKGANSATLTITTDMAPFVDVNTDGNYNPMDGDYPDIKGDQMLWWVFSDNGNAHNNATNGGQALKVEVHAKAYGYKRNTLIDNVVYYEYDIANKSPNNYSQFRFGVWADADLGYFQDDYIGFDSTHRMGIVYNGKTVDGSGQSNAYGSQIPVAGVTFLKMPGDHVFVYQPAGSFMSYNNDTSPLGNPEVDSDYSHFLRATWRNGSHLKNTFKGPGIASTGYGSGADINYIFPGDPANKTQWSECVSNNFPGDRRFIIATNDYNFAAGTSTQVAFALVVTVPGNTGCPNTSFTDITKVADSAWITFGNPIPTSVKDINTANGNGLNIYPNPVHDKLFITGKNNNIQVYDAMGRRMNVNSATYADKTEIDVTALPAGVYHLVDQNTAGKQSTFIKE